MEETYKYINSIKSIEDFKSINRCELECLATEIRAFLVENISKTGGHLASNLGVVELTIALHSVFDSPKDEIVFDVGHQSYVHKILTGRAQDFHSLRKQGGISGFPKRCESEHDVFETGHASTSVSAALGLLRAKRILNKDGHVVALVGDGAMAGGLCLEGLNDAGHSKLPLIVILNDNDMSISKNVGALNGHLSRVRTSTSYRRFKRGLRRMLENMPTVGKALFKRLRGMRNRLKFLLMPNIMFEQMGFTYLGPVDGHDISSLINVLTRAKEQGEPVIIHVETKKGKGYSPAEENPELFHGIGKFEPKTGETSLAKSETNSAVFSKALVKAAKEDEKIVAITAAMAVGTGLCAFEKDYPERFFDVGIAEEHGITMAAGMAAGGLKPAIVIYSTFLQRAYDELLHDVCLQALPVVIGVDRAGLVGDDGTTHQGVYDIAFLRTLPNLWVLSPSTKQQLEEMVNYVFKAGHAAAIRYNRGALQSAPLSKDFSPLRWHVTHGELASAEVIIIASGRLCETAQSAANGLDAAVVEAVCIQPMDKDMLKQIAATQKSVITMEDGIITGGLGEAIKAHLAGTNEVEVCGVMETPVEHATITQQDEICGLNESAIRERLLRILEDKHEGR